MGLLQEIEDGASGDEMPLGTLLRKCLVLASRLNSQPAIDWVEWELQGYPEAVAVPEYRTTSVILKVNMSDFTRQVTGWTVPSALLGDRAEEWTTVICRDSVGSLEHFLGKAETTVNYHMGNLLFFLRSRKFTEMEITSAWGEGSSSKLAHILDIVRTRVLKFALELGKEYPNAGSVGAKMKDEQERVNQLFINNIYGSANVVGTANHSNVVINVLKGDFASLKQTLEKNGVSEADIKELRTALAAEPSATTSGFGTRVAGWMGKMMTKAAEGSWAISTSVAGDLLGKALGAYYGLS